MFSFYKKAAIYLAIASALLLLDVTSWFVGGGPSLLG